MWLSGFDTGPEPDSDRPGAIVEPVPRIEPLEVGPHGALAATEHGRDLLICESIRDEAENLVLSRAESDQCLHLFGRR